MYISTRLTMVLRKLQFGIFGCLILAFFPVHLTSHTLEGLPGSHLTPAATPLGHLGLTVGLSGFGHTDASMILDGRFLTPTVLDSLDTNDVQDLLSGTLRLNLAVGLGPFVDLGLSVPFHMDYLGETTADALSGGAPGDPSVALKAGFPAVGDYVLSMGLLGSATFPLKSSEGFLPRHPGYLDGDTVAEPRFFSSGGIGGTGLALVTMDLTRLETPVSLRGSLNAGVRYPGLGGNLLVLGGGLAYAPLPFLSVSADVQTLSELDAPGGLKIGRDWALASLGFQANSDDGVFFGASVHKAASKRPLGSFQKVADVEGRPTTFRWHGRSLPDWSFALSLGWSGAFMSRDADEDGVPDKQDPCPRDKEDVDGYSDFDGCPDEDNDLDSIHDTRDKCPMEPEDLDGFEDHDGCPETDNDQDGLIDGRDKCPVEPEDKDGFEDYDGCPDLDNDKDGVLDPNDKCPTEAEDVDQFEDQNGCPDPDNDQDRILDTQDKCPLEPETVNGFEDLDGCPDVARQAPPPLEPRTVLRGVQFEGATAEFLFGAYAALDQLADKLKANPAVMVEVRAYMDKSGSELEQFRKSEARAVAVRNYLVSRGVPGSQVLARGMGSRDPITSNKTAAGRLQNRRIEVWRLN